MVVTSALAKEMDMFTITQVEITNVKLNIVTDFTDLTETPSMVESALNDIWTIAVGISLTTIDKKH